MTLERGASHLVVRPAEGGVADRLVVGGRSVLARSPWHDDVRPSAEPAEEETGWVRRWRGGWQLCFPTAGSAEPGATPRQGFHGAASQAPWRVIQAAPDAVRLHWSDDPNLEAERAWRVLENGLSVTTAARNSGIRPRILAVAEHLVLGGDLLRPVFDGMPLRIDVPEGARLALLDYAGTPTGSARLWPGPSSERWERVDDRTPARVAALLDPDPKIVQVIGPEVTATIRWEGLSHALIWEELAQSAEPPWLGAVTALGIEPTTTPHGAGTASGEGLVELAPGVTMTWTVELRISDTIAERRDEP